MLSAQEELSRIRVEARHLRINIAVVTRARIAQKNRADALEEEVKQERKRNEELTRENQKLKEQIEKIKKQRDTYKGMVFKPNQVKKEVVEEIFGGETRSRGGHIGHKGYGRKLPGRVDKTYRIFFHHCPHCHTPLGRGTATKPHTVTDIPAPADTKPVISQYQSERQWCPTCQKEVYAIPAGVVPNCRLGVNLITQILVWKYRGKQTLNQIRDNLQTTFGLSVSSGGIQQILHRTKRYFGHNYNTILKDIRGSPVKHADETGHRIGGVNGWLWEFLTPKAVYYTIEETRGKGVPEKVLGEIKEDDVLVHDDYSSYQGLPGKHQSCWAHLLRQAKEEASLTFASKEVKELHACLKELFASLSRSVTSVKTDEERQTSYELFNHDLNQIIQMNYQREDAQRVQARIRHQETNLLTALLYEGVPLTNNLAERNIRPMVIARKISGGSRSANGAETLAVNASIVQTIKLRNQPLLPTLKDLVLKGATGKN